jgi:hypothetical protein
MQINLLRLRNGERAISPSIGLLSFTALSIAVDLMLLLVILLMLNSLKFTIESLLKNS